MSLPMMMNAVIGLESMSGCTKDSKSVAVDVKLLLPPELT
jgi:hypothetical protein